MARTCTICTSQARESIDAELVAGAALRDIAGRHGVTSSALQRHRRAHLSPALAILQAERAKQGERLVDRIERLIRDIEHVRDSAKAEGRASLLLAAARELRETLKLYGAASGELRPEGVQVNVVNIAASAEWLELRQAILTSLRRHPEALADVTAALRALPSYVAPQTAHPPWGVDGQGPRLLPQGDGFNGSQAVADDDR